MKKAHFVNISHLDQVELELFFPRDHAVTLVACKAKSPPGECPRSSEKPGLVVAEGSAPFPLRKVRRDRSVAMVMRSQ